jgi:hypothetical protein
MLLKCGRRALNRHEKAFIPIINITAITERGDDNESARVSVSQGGSAGTFMKKGIEE